MKIGNYNITLKNIGAFIQGNTRAFLHNYGNNFFSLDSHIQEQVAYRTALANKECLNKGVCKCNCKIPELFYADKQCEDKCYPLMMSKEDWEAFKLKDIEPVELILNERKQLITSLVNVTFDVKEDEVTKRDLEKNKIYDFDFSIKNNTTLNYKVIQAITSCSCTEVTAPEFILSDNVNNIIKYRINTKNKIGRNGVIITLRLSSVDLSQIHDFDFVINFTVKND